MADTEKETKLAASKKSAAKKKSANPVNPISRYLRETRGELRKVTWPTQDESWRLTAIVLGVSLAFSIFLWVFDSVFSNAIKFFLQQAIA